MEQEAPMADIPEPLNPHVTIQFKQSSTSARSEGYEVRCDEHATIEQVDRAVRLAARARQMCLEELASLPEKEESFE